MELTYTTPEALQGKQFMASRDPSFNDIRDYLTLPSTPILGVSDVRHLTVDKCSFNCLFSSVFV